MKKPTKKKRRKKRKKSQKKKKNQKNYANYQNTYSQPAFECWECLSADSFEDCQNRGKYVQCNGGSIGCDITVRSRRNNRYRNWYIEKVQMGCKQMQSCMTEHQFNFGYHPQVGPISISGQNLFSASPKILRGQRYCSGITRLVASAAERRSAISTGSRTSQIQQQSGTQLILMFSQAMEAIIATATAEIITTTTTTTTIVKTTTTTPITVHTMVDTTMAKMINKFVNKINFYTALKKILLCLPKIVLLIQLKNQTDNL